MSNNQSHCLQAVEPDHTKQRCTMVRSDTTEALCALPTLAQGPLPVPAISGDAFWSSYHNRVRTIEWGMDRQELGTYNNLERRREAPGGQFAPDVLSSSRTWPAGVTRRIGILSCSPTVILHAYRR